MLVGSVEQIAVEIGNKSVKVPASITAYKFYEKLGYKPVEEAESEEFGKSTKMEKCLG